MSKTNFLLRALIIILSVVTLNILGIEVLVFFSSNATVNEIYPILRYPLPLAVGLVFIYCVIVYFYSVPILKFLEADSKSETVDAKLLEKSRGRSLNLAYFLSALSFPAYITGGVVGVLIVSKHLSWPVGFAFYGLIGGIIAGLLTIPLSIFASSWVIHPILERISELSAEMDISAKAGLKLTLGSKFLMLVIILILGISGYILTISYSQIDAALTNMEKLEKLLPLSATSKLADTIEFSADPRVKSSSYFKSRLGSIRNFYISLMVFAVFLTVFLALAATRELTRPVRSLKLAANRVKEGDYDISLRLVGNDEFTELGEAFNQMTLATRTQLEHGKNLLTAIGNAVKTLAPMSEAMVSISEEEASASIEQASAAEEAATTAQEIVSVAKQIAENAANVSELGETTRNITESGADKLLSTRSNFDDINAKMKDIAKAVLDLGDRSQEIGAVTSIIDEISEQTNLLALNAAIEAVGAGEHGQRFGVVAQEIRRLAQNTANSTKKIHENIERMQKSVSSSIMFAEEGDKAVSAGLNVLEELSSIFNDIFNANKNTAPRLKEIGLMTSQQASASEQMTKTINEVRETAHRGSSASGEIQSSIKELDVIISQLKSHTDAD